MVVLVEQDGRSGGGPQLHGAAHVVNVSMCDDNLFHLEIVLADEGEDIFDVVTGINHHRLERAFVTNDGAVALQRAHGKDFVDHGLVVGHQSSVVRKNSTPQQ